MTRTGRRPLATFCLLGLTLLLVACGTQGIDLPDDATEQERQGAQLFAERCSGCHTLDITGSEGSADQISDRERKDGPNFNVRVEDKESVLYAIRNGGFSSGPMPQNIVMGEEAEAVAAFLARFAGADAEGAGGDQASASTAD
jgi:mono/diheme cytochrome c family protein